MARLKVIQEKETGMNERFRDNLTGQELTRTDVKRGIDNGTYHDYEHYRQEGKLVIRSKKGVENLG